MRIVAVSNRKGTVSLNEDVNQWSVNELITEIDELFGNTMVGRTFGPQNVVASAADALETLTLDVNSPGGSILDGYRLYNVLLDLRDRGVRVVAKINALAGSMASVIVMAADEIQMVTGGRMMIHEASTMTWGDSRDHQRNAVLLDEMSGEIAAIYADRTGKSVEEMRDMMFAETWMGAEQAKELGFIDTILSNKRDKPVKSAAARAGNRNADLLQRINQLTGDSAATPNTNTTMFNSRKELLDKIAALESDQSEFENTIKGLETQVEDLKGAAQNAAELTNKVTELTDEITGLKDENETLANDLKAEQAKTTPEAIQALVAKEVAKTGVDPVDVVDSDEEEVAEVTDAELKAKYENATAQDLIALRKADPELYARLRTLD